MRRRIFTVAVALFLIMLLLNFITGGAVSAFLRPSEKIIFGTHSFIQKITNPIYITFVSKKKLQKENEQLKNKLISYELYALNNKILKDENDTLRAFLGGETLTQKVQKRHLENVLTTSGIMHYGVVPITFSGSYNSHIGSLVFWGNDALIGTVQNVYKHTQDVLLFSASGAKTNVLLRTGKRDIPMEVQGIGAGNMVGKLPRDIVVKKGDSVIYKSAPEVVLGIVGSVEAKPSDALQTIRIYVPIKINSIKQVLVE